MKVSDRLVGIYRVLGRPDRRSAIHTSGSPVLIRLTWKCGCAVDVIDNDRDDGEVVLQWQRCANHHPTGEGSVYHDSAG
jgi:hypothetical protein